MKRLVKWFGIGAASLLGLGLLGALGGYWWLLQSLPKIDGEIEGTGVTSEVAITRDQHGIPHIEAETLEEAMFAQGFVHAQDRLWQMEFQRRVGAGRLAEILGADALPTDRFMRLLGLYRLAEASLDHLLPESLAWLDAYADGVNAYLTQRRGPLPPEFLIFGHHELEPWTPADSVVWIKMMAMTLSLNWHDELLRARLRQRLSDEQIADLWPGYPSDAPVTLAGLAEAVDLDALASVLPPAPLPGIGSNAWSVAGEHSESGGALLANDPHLGLRSPGTWYLTHLKTPGLELIGVGLPGVPGLVLGHNGKIAWGVTNTGPDSQDLFIEKIDPDLADHYLTPDGSTPFERREEILRVKDGAPVTLTVRGTRHGPVISDLVSHARETLPGDQVLALAWTALVEEDTTIDMLFGITKARDWLGFVEATKRSHTPQLNIFYADDEGRIGFIAPGHVPVRKNGDGLWPVPGWSGDFDWIGSIPFNDLPRSIDPPSGRLLNGNNRIVEPDYGYLITAIWEPPYRARRIEALLKEARHDLGSFAAIQADELSLIAVDILPLMLAMTPASKTAAEAAAALQAWDRVMERDAREPLIFAAWYRAFSRLVYEDELGALFPEYWSLRPQFMMRVLEERPVWCDNQGTPAIETCGDLLTTALDQALDDLAARYGADQSDWRWGEAHQARMRHPILDLVPVLGRIFNIEIPTGGDGVTVNVGHFRFGDADNPFASTQAATYRGLYDLADLDRSRFITATGQSGHPLSVHFRDLSRLWADGETIPMARHVDRYGPSAAGRLFLRP